MVFIDQIARSKAVCPFNYNQDWLKQEYDTDVIYMAVISILVHKQLTTGRRLAEIRSLSEGSTQKERKRSMFK